MTQPSFTVAIAGCGAGIAESHFRALAQLPNARIVGGCDVSRERGEPRAAQVNAPFFTDHRAMVEATKPDIVAVCTPHPFHAQIAIDALAGGAHVLTEKPMAIQVADADRMIAAAEAAKKLLAVNFQQRFKPVIERAKAIVESGELGDLMRVQVTESWFRSAKYYADAPWRGTWRGEGGAILLNQSPHTMDLLCHLAGRPMKVWGWIRTRLHAIECEDTAQAMLEFGNGAPGYFTASTAEAGPGPQPRIYIAGERGTLELIGPMLTMTRFTQGVREFAATSPSPWNAPDMTQEVMELPGDGGHIAVYRDLFDAIEHGHQPRVSGRDAILSLELANAIIYSDHIKQPVTLPLDRAGYAEFLREKQGK